MSQGTTDGLWLSVEGGTVDSRYYELACYEVPVTTRFFAGPKLPHACFNALKY